MVQSAPGEAAFVAVSQRVGLSDAPFHQRIPLYIIGTASFGGAIQPMSFIGGKADTLVQGQLKAALMCECQQVGFQSILLAPRTPANGSIRPAAPDHMHLACFPPDYRIFGKHPVKRRLVRFHIYRQSGTQACNFQAGEGFKFFQMFVHFGKFPSGIKKHDIGHGFAAFKEHEQHGRAVLSTRQGNDIRCLLHGYFLPCPCVPPESPGSCLW